MAKRKKGVLELGMNKVEKDLDKTGDKIAKGLDKSAKSAGDSLDKYLGLK